MDDFFTETSLEAFLSLSSEQSGAPRSPKSPDMFLPTSCTPERTALFNLPPEMFLQIASLMSSNDLANLFLTCRALSANRYLKIALYSDPFPAFETYTHLGRWSHSSGKRLKLFLRSLSTYNNGIWVTRIVLERPYTLKNLRLIEEACPNADTVIMRTKEGGDMVIRERDGHLGNWGLSCPLVFKHSVRGEEERLMKPDIFWEQQSDLVESMTALEVQVGA